MSRGEPVDPSLDGGLRLESVWGVTRPSPAVQCDVLRVWERDLPRREGGYASQMPQQPVSVSEFLEALDDLRQ